MPTVQVTHQEAIAGTLDDADSGLQSMHAQCADLMKRCSFGSLGMSLLQTILPVEAMKHYYIKKE